MAISATQYVTLVAPSYAGNANLSLYLAAAAEQMNTCQWGNNYNQAQAYLACHMIAMTDSVRSGAVGGAITSKTEGKLSISFGSSTGNSDLSATSYGLAYQRLLLGSAGPALLVTGVPCVG